MAKKTNRRPSRKKIGERVWENGDWVVVSGRLVPGPGRPDKEGHLFRFVGEKLPFECLKDVSAHVRQNSDDLQGVYMAHDSMGVARYGGRGNVFGRLRDHKRSYVKELQYFSFFIIKNKKHEREIETAILRAAGPQMTLNERKIAIRLATGNVTDYEPGTEFLQRQSRRGRKAARGKKK